MDVQLWMPTADSRSIISVGAITGPDDEVRITNCFLHVLKLTFQLGALCNVPLPRVTAECDPSSERIDAVNQDIAQLTTPTEASRIIVYLSPRRCRRT